MLLTLALLTFALPVEQWRTGKLPAPRLNVQTSGPQVNMPRRIWVDTDAACGHSRRTDPDDCIALLLLLRAPNVDVVGISTVHGNAELEVTNRTAHDLTAVVARDGIEPPTVHRGSSMRVNAESGVVPEPAHAALRQALAQGPLILVSLGPLTNISAALQDRPDLQAKVARLVAVMGRRPGHLFHPAEGRSSGGILFGHGPVFSDFNFDQDRAAAVALLRMRLPTTFIPYEAATKIRLTVADLARMEASGGPAHWVAKRSRGWLDFWRRDVGLPGFYPFDALGAAYVIEPRLFDCAETSTWIGQDDELWNVFYDPPALLVGREQDRPDDAHAVARGLYCPSVSPRLHEWLISRLTSE